MAADNGKPKGSINFISFDKPGISDGVYELSVSQGFAVGTDEIKASDTQKKLRIAALGPRFSLDPQMVVSRFPEDKSVGEYFTVLPHVVFKSSILPWERKIANDVDAPWIALLLFTKDEVTVQTVSLDVLRNPPADRDWQFPAATLEPGQQPTDRVHVIDVEGSLLQQVLPAKESLQYLAHIRQSADQADEPEYPILITSRLPPAGKVIAIHLVSLENRTDLFEEIDAKKKYRIVSLLSWSFTSTNDKLSFKDLLLEAYQNDQDGAASTSRNVLRLPTIAPSGTNSDASVRINGLYTQGFLPVPHQTRQGNNIVSWYRGPLSPGVGVETVDFTKLQISAADSLVRYDESLGMFDVSYAAAWELGRLLMLRSRRVSVALFNWKRAMLQSARPIVSRHLPLGQPQTSIKLPGVVKDWFEALGTLKDVPYNYLVPDERMLPQPSIRFFSLDLAWMAYLTDGAFSIGRVISNKPAIDAFLRSAIPVPPAMSGFLLRSPVVAGWSHIEVRGYNIAGGGSSFEPAGVTDANVLPLLRMDRIAPDALFCLFSGDLKTVDLSEKPEVIHFGVAYEDGKGASQTQCYYKVLRDPTTGDEYNVDPTKDNVCNNDPNGHWVRVFMRGASSNLIDIAKLRDDLGSARQNARQKGIQPNKFAAEMIEGVGKVRFERVQS